MAQDFAFQITKLQLKRFHGVHGKRTCLLQEEDRETNA